MIAGKLYVVGGLGACCVAQDNLKIYGPQTDSWSAGPPDEPGEPLPLGTRASVNNCLGVGYTPSHSAVFAYPPRSRLRC